MKEKEEINTNKWSPESSPKSTPKTILKHDKMKMKNDDNREIQNIKNVNNDNNNMNNKNEIKIESKKDENKIKNSDVVPHINNPGKVNKDIVKNKKNKNNNNNKITTNHNNKNDNNDNNDNKMKNKNEHKHVVIQDEPINNDKTKIHTSNTNTNTNINFNINDKINNTNNTNNNNSTSGEMKDNETTQQLTKCEEYCGVGKQCPDPCPPPFEKTGEGKRELIGHESFNMNTIDEYRVKYGLETDHMKRVNPCDWIVNNANLSGVELERTERIQMLIDQVLSESQPERNSRGQLLAPSFIEWI